MAPILEEQMALGRQDYRLVLDVKSEKKAFLLLLPFEVETWRRAKELLAERETEYWADIRANPYPSKGHLLEAAERFLANARSRAAMECIDLLIHDKGTPPPDFVVCVLKDNLTSKEPTNSLDQHAVIDLINWLQENPRQSPMTFSKLSGAIYRCSTGPPVERQSI